MKKTFFYLMAICCSFLVISCDDDDSPVVNESDSTTPIFQQYEVNFYPENKNDVNVFANFFSNDRHGDRLRLVNDASISVNTSSMLFWEDPAMSGGYSYTQKFAKHPDEISFVFKRRDNTVYVNKVTRDDVGTVVMPTTLTKIKNGEAFTLDYDFSRLLTDEELICTLRQTGSEIVYRANVNQILETLTFSGVPAGFYTLQVMTKRVVPTTNNDLPAEGEIILYYVDFKTIEIL